MNIYLYEKVEYIYRWAINESVKIDNIVKWIAYEPQLIKYVSRKLHIPSIVENARIKLLVDFRLNQLRTLFPSYYNNLNLEEFNYPKNKVHKITCILLVKYYVRIFKIKKYFRPKI